MRIHVATIGAESHHALACAGFERLAKQDEVGRHRLEESPERADAILVVDLQQHPEDPLLKQLRRHSLVQRYANKVFVYDERDFPFYTFPGVYVGAPATWLERFPVFGGPYCHVQAGTSSDVVTPDLLFCFRGTRTHPVRHAVLKLSHERGVVEESSVNFFADQADHGHSREAAIARYAELVTRSKFVLCPRGHGPSSLRLYETLRANRVPVVISDDWLPPPRIDWGGCVVRVAERNTRHVPRILEEIELSWHELVDRGRRVSGEFSRQRLWNHYGDSLEALSDCHRSRAHVWRAQSRRMRVRLRLLRSSPRERGSLIAPG